MNLTIINGKLLSRGPANGPWSIRPTRDGVQTLCYSYADNGGRTTLFLLGEDIVESQQLERMRKVLNGREIKLDSNLRVALANCYTRTEVAKLFQRMLEFLHLQQFAELTYTGIRRVL